MCSDGGSCCCESVVSVVRGLREKGMRLWHDFILCVCRVYGYLRAIIDRLARKVQREREPIITISSHFVEMERYQSKTVLTCDTTNNNKKKVTEVLSKDSFTAKPEQGNLKRSVVAMPPRRSARLAALHKSEETSSSSPPASPNSKKSKNSPPPSTPPPSSLSKKQKKKKLTALTPTAEPQGVIDPASGITQGTIVCHEGTPCDVRMVLVDPSQNADKYYVLQWILEDNHDDSDQQDSQHVIFTRWGRTGTQGQALVQRFETAALAQSEFEQKFVQKSGLAWSDRRAPAMAGKYRVIRQDFAAKRNGYTGATWQYWVDDGVDGKPDGWYPYDAAGSQQVELLYSEHARNPNLLTRTVESGHFAYQVNLQQMRQTNIRHPARKTRHIRRCPVGKQMDNLPPRNQQEQNA